MLTKASDETHSLSHSVQAINKYSDVSILSLCRPMSTTCAQSSVVSVLEKRKRVYASNTQTDSLSLRTSASTTRHTHTGPTVDCNRVSNTMGADKHRRHNVRPQYLCKCASVCVCVCRRQTVALCSAHSLVQFVCLRMVLSIK